MVEKSKYINDLIRLFVVREKQERFRELSSSHKRYDDFLHELLNDPRNLEEEFIHEIPGKEQAQDLILRRLKELGAGPLAYLVSEVGEEECKIDKLEDLVRDNACLSTGILIYCIGTSLGYYEGHEGWRYILISTRR